MHLTGPGGRLDVHVDFNVLEKRNLFRRLNILVYLNPTWHDEWGGQIELWDKDVKVCHLRSQPIINKCLIFETSNVSYHGVAPLKTPGGRHPALVRRLLLHEGTAAELGRPGALDRLQGAARRDHAPPGPPAAGADADKAERGLRWVKSRLRPISPPDSSPDAATHARRASSYAGHLFSDKISARQQVSFGSFVSHLRLLPSPPPELTSDEACLDAFQRELDYVHRTLRRLGTTPSEVDDLAQEVFLALHGAGPLRPRRPLRPYLFGIAFRISAAHHRKRKREVTFEIVEVSDSGPGPDDALATKQARALVLAALERIPLPRRGVLVMHDIDDVPVEDVAAALGIPRFTVYSRLRKARRELEAAVRRLTSEARSR